MVLNGCDRPLCSGKKALRDGLIFQIMQIECKGTNATRFYFKIICNNHGTKINCSFSSGHGRFQPINGK